MSLLPSPIRVNGLVVHVRSPDSSCGLTYMWSSSSATSCPLCGHGLYLLSFPQYSSQKLLDCLPSKEKTQLPEKENHGVQKVQPKWLIWN